MNSPASITITENEIIQALQDAVRQAPGDDNAVTTDDILAVTGWGEHKLRRHMRAIKASGRLESTRVMRESIDGRMCAVPAYRIKSDPSVSAKSRKRDSR